MKSIGNIAHNLDRLEEIVSKEVIITYREQVKILKKEKQREVAAKDRVRRQKALLNVPLLDTRPRASKKDNPTND